MLVVVAPSPTPADGLLPPSAAAASPAGPPPRADPPAASGEVEGPVVPETPPVAEAKRVPRSPPPNALNEVEAEAHRVMVLDEGKDHQLAFRPKCPYLARHRPQLVGWVIGACAKSMPSLVSCQACRIMDCVFATGAFDDESQRRMYQGIAAICILLAAKVYGDVHCYITLDHLVKMCKRVFSWEDFRVLEIKILVALEWNVTGTTPRCFLETIFRALGPLLTDTRHSNIYRVLGLSMQDREMMNYRPSVVAAALCLCVCEPDDKDASEWRTCVMAFNTDSNSLEACVEALRGLDSDLLQVRRTQAAAAAAAVPSKAVNRLPKFAAAGQRIFRV